MRRRYFILCIFLLASILVTSCNHVLFVKKSKILHEQEGYLFDQTNQLLFVPMDIREDFINQIDGKKAYKIAGNRENRVNFYTADTDSMTIQSHDFDRDTKKNVLWKEKVYTYRVRILYTPYENTRLLQKSGKEKIGYQNGDLKFDYKGKTYSFRNYLIFDGDILRIERVDSAGNRIGRAID